MATRAASNCDQPFRLSGWPLLLVLLCFILGSALRLALYAANPVENSYDDHFTPIFLWAQSGEAPPSDACWECAQPPAFYWISSTALRMLLAVGTPTELFPKLLQFLPCLYGILTLPLILLILWRLRLSSFATCLSFGVICFLPRHIYLSSMHSNDTFSYFCVALTIWLALEAGQRKLSPIWLLGLGLSLSVTLFAKLTTLCVLPALLTYSFLVVRGSDIDRTRLVLYGLLVFLLPSLLWSGFLINNKVRYGSFIVDIQDQLNLELPQRPGEGNVSFLSFRPDSAIQTPIVSPTYVHSFWTQVYARTWFDAEPRFLCLTAGGRQWCNAVYGYLEDVEQDAWPGLERAPARQIQLGRALVALGLVPLLLSLLGIYRVFAAMRRQGGWMPPAALAMLGVLFLCNAAGIVNYALYHPFYSSMKATYLLNSLPTGAALMALGLSALDGRRRLQWGVALPIGLLLLLSAYQIHDLALAMQGSPHGAG
jgi:4-amino-4-deoxy-L-arabinose transferase-like glycosyltransferase